MSHDDRRLLVRISALFDAKEWRDDGSEAASLVRRIGAMQSPTPAGAARRISSDFLARNSIRRSDVQIAFEEAWSEISSLVARSEEPTSPSTRSGSGPLTASKTVTMRRSPLQWLEHHPLIRTLSLLGGVAGGLAAIVLVFSFLSVGRGVS